MHDAMFPRRFGLQLLEDRINCSTFVVTNTLDYHPDPFIGIPIPGSLRYEIKAAIDDPALTTPTITFDLAKFSTAQVINLNYGSLVIRGSKGTFCVYCRAARGAQMPIVSSPNTSGHIF